MSKEYRQQSLELRIILRKLRSRRDIQGIQLYNEIRWEYLNLLEKREIYWKQRAKNFWLREGDRNTRFFHNYASIRRKNILLQCIQNSNGDWKDTPEEIEEVIENYFTQLFSSSN